MTVPLLSLPPRHWSCPNCDETLVTGTPKLPLHRCRGLRGVWAPFVQDGLRAKVEVVERGDYVGLDDVQTDNEGRPVMAVTAERDDGIDCVVLAPTASTRDER